MILITTSRKPSKKTRSLAREFSHLIPFSTYTSRGKKSIEDLIELARSKGHNRICILKEKYGNPFKFDFINIEGGSWNYLENSIIFNLIKLQREIIKEKIMFDDIKFDGDQKIKMLFNIFEESIDTKNIMCSKRGFITFVRNGKEIGPVLKYRVVKWKK
jgi:rRNA maturation protein Rpf1